MEQLTGGEFGFLLLTSSLGNPDRKPLTAPQLRELFRRSREMAQRESHRDVAVSDLLAMGYSQAQARHILGLLQEEEQLRWYLAQARRRQIVPITRASQTYPGILRRRLDLESPGCLWARGDLTLLRTPAVSLVGSRELREENRAFAEAAGRQAARQGLTLVSGNARGADQAAQNACLEAGGGVISVVADSLMKHKPKEGLLYLSEGSYDGEFTPQRALSRNRIIHALGRITLVAQSDLGKGGTWSGTTQNLRQGWSPVACFRDGSAASEELEQRGAYLVGTEDLKDLCAFREPEAAVWDL